MLMNVASKCFSYGYKNVADATWNQLIQALKKVEFDHLASKINGMLKSNDMLHNTEGIIT